MGLSPFALATTPDERIIEAIADLRREVGQAQRTGGTLGSIGGDKLRAGSITAGAIAAGTITAELIAAGTITAVQIAAGSITAVQIAAGAITAGAIAAGSITTTHMTAGTIQADRLVAGTVTTELLAANAVTGDKIVGGAVTADKISVTNLAAVSANMGTLTSGTITGATVQTGAGGARVVLNSGGITAYGTDGTTPVLAFSNSTGNLTLAGTVTANAQSILPVAALQGELAGSNLLRNSSFESTAGGNPAQQFDQWSAETLNAGQTSTDTDPRSGARSARANANGAYIYRGQDVALPKGKYVYSAWIKTAALTGGVARIGVSVLTGAGTAGPGPTTTGTTGWTRYTQTLEITSATATVRCYFLLGDSGGPLPTSGTAWFDDLKLEEGEKATPWAPRVDEILPGTIRGGLDGSSSMIVAGTIVGGDLVADTITATQIAASAITAVELAANAVTAGKISAGAVTTAKLAAGAVTADKITVGVGGGNLWPDSSFEAGPPGSQFQWGGTGGGTYSTITVTSTDGVHGAKYLRIAHNGAGDYFEAGWWRNQWLRQGQTYTISVWSKTNGPNGSVDGSGNPTSNGNHVVFYLGPTVGYVYKPLTGDNTWRRYTHTWTHTGATGLTEMHIAQGRATASSFIDFDAGQLEEGDVATAWRPYVEGTVIDGSTITGGTFQTARTGARVMMDSAGLRAYQTDGTTTTFDIAASSGAVTITGGTIRTATGARLELTTAGLKLYGSSGASDPRIEIDATTAEPSIKFGNATLAAGLGNARFGKLYGDTVSGAFQMEVRSDNGLQVLNYGASAAARCEASAFNVISDERTKTAILPIDSPLARIRRMRGVTFAPAGGGKRRAGVIAQEAASALTEAAGTTVLPNFGEVEYVDLGAVLGLVVEALKELANLAAPGSVPASR